MNKLENAPITDPHPHVPQTEGLEIGYNNALATTD